MSIQEREIKELKAVVAELSDRLKVFGEDSVDRIVESSEQVREQVDVLAKKAGAYAKENPWHVAAAVAGVGLVAALLLRSRSED